MDKMKRTKMKDLSNDNLFSLLDDYLKRTIANDLERIYKKEVYVSGSQNSWVFQLEQ